jgi:hypothetical protein
MMLLKETSIIPPISAKIIKEKKSTSWSLSVMLDGDKINHKKLIRISNPVNARE